jgi:hypothetical protein
MGRIAIAVAMLLAFVPASNAVAGRKAATDACEAVGKVAYMIAQRRDEGYSRGIVKFSMRENGAADDSTLALVDMVYGHWLALTPREVEQRAFKDCARHTSLTR